MKYHYTNAQNQPVGPVEWEELQGLAAQGVINDRTLVIAEGAGVWTSYGQTRSGTAVANALASGLSHASSAAAAYPWGSTLFGLLLAILGCFTLPWTVFTSAARELAVWGRQRALPLALSDVPVLTFYTIVVRNAFLVIFGSVFAIWSVLALFGAGPLYSGGFDWLTAFRFGQVINPAFEPAIGTATGWNAQLAVRGFLFGAMTGYFGQVFFAFWFELLSLGVRIANDIKRLSLR